MTVTFLDRICREAWRRTERTLATGTPSTPTTRLEKIAESIWSHTNRTVYQKHKVVTVDNTNVDADLTDFPLYVPTSGDVDIQATIDSNGYGICFTDLNHQHLEFERVAKDHYFVKIPTIASGSPTEFLIWYKDGSEISGEQIFKYEVWDSGYRSVYHFAQDPSGTILDSTRYENHGTADGGMDSSDLISGPAGYALDFDGDNDRIVFGNATSRLPYLTLEFIYNLRSITSTDTFIIQGSTSQGGWKVDCDSTSNRRLQYWRDETPVDKIARVTNGFDTGTWTYIALTDDFSSLLASDVSIYKNAVLQTFAGQDAGSQKVETIGNLQVGASSNSLDGYLTELRISDIIRSFEYIKFVNYNLLENDHELSFGAEQGGDGGETSLDIDRVILSEYLTSMSIDTTINTSHLLNIIQTYIIENEYLGLINNDERVLLEYISELNNDKTVNTEWILNINNNQVINFSHLLELINDKTLNEESLSLLNIDYSKLLEYVSTLHNDQLLNNEGLNTLDNSQTTHLEYLISFADDSTLTIEHLLLLNSDGDITLEFFGTININFDGLVPIEYTVFINSDGIGSLEFNQAINTDIESVYEYLLSLTKDAQTVLEFLQTQESMDVTTAIEHLSQKDIDGVLSDEWVSQLAFDKQTVVEYLLSLNADNAVVFELLKDFSTDDLISLEYLQGLDLDGIISLEYRGIDLTTVTGVLQFVLQNRKTTYILPSKNNTYTLPIRKNTWSLGE
jgi:hypothetical protein